MTTVIILFASFVIISGGEWCEVICLALLMIIE